MLTREESWMVVPVARDELVDLLVGRAPLEPSLHAEPEHGNRRGGRSWVDHAHRRRPPSISAADWALAKVPDSVEEIWIDRIRS